MYKNKNRKMETKVQKQGNRGLRTSIPADVRDDLVLSDESTLKWTKKGKKYIVEVLNSEVHNNGI